VARVRSEDIGPYLHLKVRLAKAGEVIEGWVEGHTENRWRIGAPGVEPREVDPGDGWDLVVVDDDRSSWNNPPL